MISEIEYALMAGGSYISTRPEINKFPIPQGWVSFNHQSLDTGFEAVSFTNGTDIVISYAGTDPASGNDLASDVIMGLGAIPDVQLLQAAKYYMQVKINNTTANFTPNITFTGHSLGGGLASLMAVFFNETAVTFDQAPFRNSANVLIATELRLYLANNFPESTYPQISQWLDPLDKFVWSFDPLGLGWSQDGLDARENKVTSLSVQGEFLSATPALRIGTALPSLTHGDYFAPIDLHSQALLSAFLQSDQTAAAGKALNDVTFKLTDLLGMIFDSKLFYHDPNELIAPEKNLLEHLVRHQAGSVDGVQAGGDAMVTRFTADLWKIAQDGGLTLKDSYGPYTNLNNVSNALIAFAMQKYYEENNPNVTYGSELFTDLNTTGTGSNGIQFDIANVSQNLNTKIQTGNVQYSDLVNDIKGFGQYFQNYLDQTGLLSPAERTIIKPILPQLRDWYIQAGTSGMNATDTLNRGAFLLGGNGSDALVGGTAADLLVGNAGADLLQGGKGNDFLLGGTGNDTYVYTTGDGLDTILDAGGQGSIVVDGAPLAGGAQYGDTRVHRDSAGHLYVDVGSPGSSVNGMVIDGNILVQNWQAGNLGINLSTTPAAAPVTTRTIVGDLTPTPSSRVYYYDWIGQPIYYSFDALGNVVVDQNTPQPGRADALDGSSGNDLILGGGGGDILDGAAGDDRLYGDSEIGVASAIVAGNLPNTGTGVRGDWLAGGSGADTLISGAGNDVLSGGGGADLLIAGAGDDDILGDSDIVAFAYSDWLASSFDWTVTDLSDGTRWYTPLNYGANWTPQDSAADVIYAGEGNDRVVAGKGNDVIFGEGGADKLYGQEGNDIIQGGAGEDWLYGNADHDYLDGGAEQDVIFGGAGNDIINRGRWH